MNLKKNFGHLPLGRFLINELNAIDLNAYANEIKQNEQQYWQECNKLLEEKANNKILASKQKKINKIDKLNATYQF